MSTVIGECATAFDRCAAPVYRITKRQMSSDHDVSRLRRHIASASLYVEERRAIVDRLRTRGEDVAEAEHSLRWTEHTLTCLVARLAAIERTADVPGVTGRPKPEAAGAQAVRAPPEPR